eukprot:3941963-Rhodomonas_salina.5
MRFLVFDFGVKLAAHARGTEPGTAPGTELPYRGTLPSTKSRTESWFCTRHCARHPTTRWGCLPTRSVVPVPVLRRGSVRRITVAMLVLMLGIVRAIPVLTGCVPAA